jgi:membrane-associated protease RseP (regulator of RpoE activity)
MATLSIGTNASFAVLSKGKQATLDIALERAPEGAKASEVTLHGRSPFSGAKVAELSPRLAQRLGMRTDVKGVTVIDINRDSPAADFGFQPGDIVREVNGTTIDTAATLEQAAKQDTRWWRFTLERGGQILRQVLRY